MSQLSIEVTKEGCAIFAEEIASVLCFVALFIQRGLSRLAWTDSTTTQKNPMYMSKKLRILVVMTVWYEDVCVVSSVPSYEQVLL